MLRIAGVTLPDESSIAYGLTKVYGIGWSRAHKMLSDLKIEKGKRVKDLDEDEIKKIIEYVEARYKIEGNLREEITSNIVRLKEVGSYRGIRHIRNLPVRGQRTRSNARVKRGKRRTVGALSKEAWSKLDQLSQQKKK